LRRDPKSLLWDARDAATALVDMTTGKSFADFDSDLVLRSACRVWRAMQDDLPGLRATLDDLLAGQ
jgi:hypothetical protein